MTGMFLQSGGREFVGGHGDGHQRRDGGQHRGWIGGPYRDNADGAHSRRRGLHGGPELRRRRIRRRVARSMSRNGPATRARRTSLRSATSSKSCMSATNVNNLIIRTTCPTHYGSVHPKALLRSSKPVTRRPSSPTSRHGWPKRSSMNCRWGCRSPTSARPSSSGWVSVAPHMG